MHIPNETHATLVRVVTWVLLAMTIGLALMACYCVTALTKEPLPFYSDEAWLIGWGVMAVIDGAAAVWAYGAWREGREALRDWERRVARREQWRNL